MARYIPPVESYGLSSQVPLRYWSEHSQHYAAGDHLLYHLYKGWTLAKDIEAQTHWYAESRYMVVYKITLCKDGQEITLPVVNNPFVRNTVLELQARLEHAEVQELDLFRLELAPVG